MKQPPTSWRQHRVDPILPRRPATCCRCARPFETKINPEIRGEYGQILRGERQVSRLCHGCRSSEAYGQDLDGRNNAYEAR